MIYFIYGEDSFRSKRKLEEIIAGYKKAHKSGLNLIYVDAGQSDFDDFYSNLKITPMFAEKKLLILRDTFANAKFQEEFTINIKNLNDTKDIIVVYEGRRADKRTKFFKALLKHAKSQEFNFLQASFLKKWIISEFEKNNAKTDAVALNILTSFGGGDLWNMSNEIKKLADYKRDSVIKKEDVELMESQDLEVCMPLLQHPALKEPVM